MKIRTRLYVLFLAVLLVTLAASYASWHSVVEYSKASGEARDLARNALLAEKIRGLVYRHVQYARFSTDEDRLDGVFEYEAAVARHLELLSRKAERPEEQQRVRDVYTGYERLLVWLDDLLEEGPQPLAGDEASADVEDQAAQEEDTVAWEPHTTGLPDAFAELEKDLDRLGIYYEAQLAQLNAQSQFSGFGTQVTVAVAVVLTVVVLLIVLFQVRQWLLRPLEQVGQAAARIGAGDLDHRLRGMAHDEIGALGRRFNEMAAQLQHHQERLLEAREFALLGAMSSSVAHGMRNPLTAIRATAQLLAGALPEEDASRERVDDIIAEVDRMTRRISGLIDFSSPTALNVEPTSVREVIRMGTKEARAALDEHGVEVAVPEDMPDLQVMIDRDRIAETLAELLRNAAVHCAPGTRVDVAAERVKNPGRAGPEVALSVRDHGEGMDAARAKQAFDLFFTTRKDGSGMGLSCARRIVELHGGSMDMESALGKGTKVVLRLPIPPP
jgi:signal transduction histidine kinase